MVRAHLQEAPIVGTHLADEDRLHRRLHVVVDATPACPLEEGEGPIVRVEDHLLALARIGPYEHHPAVTEPKMGDLDDRGHTGDQHDIVAPVELVGLPWRERQRHIGFRARRRVPLGPDPGIAAHRIVAALVATSS